MVRITPKGQYSIAAAILGLFSFVLPWISFTLSNGAASASSGESPLTLLSDLVTAPPVSPATDSAILAWQRMAEAGIGVWVVGAVIFLVACFVTLAQSFESTRTGGVWMLLGVLVSAAGILAVSVQFRTDAGFLATVGPSAGLGLAVIASLVALVPAFKVDGEDRWVRDPWDRGWLQPALPPNPTAPGRHGATPQATPNRAPFAAPPADVTPTAVPSPSVTAAEVPERRFCPECGAWYLAGESACPRDGSSLKPVGESDAR